MDTAKYTLILTFGDQTVDYSDQLLAESIKRKLCIGKAGKHEIQTCDFQLKNSVGVTTRIFTANEDILAVLKRDGEPYFTGVIRPYARQKITQMRSEPISLQILDNSKLLEKSVFGNVEGLTTAPKEGTVFSQRWQNVSLINRSNPNRSLVHLLFHAAKLSIDYTVHCPFDRTESFPLFMLKKDDTLSDVIDTLLYEYGLTYRATESGDFKIMDLAPDGFEATEVISEFLDSLSIDKPDVERNTVKVTYGDLMPKGFVPVWDSGLTASEPARLKYHDVYPDNAQDHIVNQPYSVKGYEDWNIYDVQGLKVLARIGNGNVVTDAVSEWDGSKMPLQLCVKQLDSENASVYVKHIDTETESVKLSKLQIKGNVWLRKSLETEISAIQGEVLSVYASKYVFEKEVADNLRDILANRSATGTLVYSFGSKRLLDIGTIVSLNDSISSLTSLVRVISRQNTLCSDVYTYECEAVSRIEYNRTSEEIEWAENFVHVPTVQVPETLTLDLSASQFNYDSSDTLKGPSFIEVRISSSGLADTPNIYINDTKLDFDMSAGSFIVTPSPEVFNSEGFIVIEAFCGSLQCRRLIAKSIDGFSAKAVSVSGPNVFKYGPNSSSPSVSTLNLHATVCGGLVGYQWYYHDGLKWQQINGATAQDYTLAHDAAFFAYDILRLACFSEGYYDEITIVKVYDGVQGPIGQDGRTTYFHIKYSPNASGSPMSETPSTFIGTYVDQNENDSTDYRDYTWSRLEGLQGEKGEQGIPGTNGEDGHTSYLHIAYANDSTGFSGFNHISGTYIGQYVDFIQQDSNNPEDYSWIRIKGEQGSSGPKGDSGPTGPQGPAGNDAKMISLEADSYIFKATDNGTISGPDSITLTTVKQNTDATVNWSSIPSGLVSGTGDTKILNKALMGSNEIIRITATCDGLSDCITIAKVCDGASGTPGSAGVPATTVMLSNEVELIPANSAGSVSAGSFICDVLGYVGTEARQPTRIDVSNLPIGISDPVQTNIPGGIRLTFSISSGLLEGRDKGTITLTVVCNGLTFVKHISWAKSKTGATGSQGQTASSYWMNVSTSSIKRGRDQRLAPESIMIIGMRQVGYCTPENYACRFKIFEATYQNPETFVVKYVSSEDETYKNFYPRQEVNENEQSHVCTVKIEMYSAGGENLLDTKTIDVLSDGLPRTLMVSGKDGAISVAGYSEEGQPCAGYWFYGNEYVIPPAYYRPPQDIKYGTVMVDLKSRHVVFSTYMVTRKGEDNAEISWVQLTDANVTDLDIVDKIIISKWSNDGGNIYVDSISPCTITEFLRNHFLDILISEGISDDVNLWAKAIGCDQVFGKLAAMDAIIKNLFVNDIRIGENGSLSGGAYNQNGNLERLGKGFYLGSDGSFKCRNAEMDNITIDFQSIFRGNIEQNALTTHSQILESSITKTYSAGCWTVDDLYTFFNTKALELIPFVMKTDVQSIFEGTSYSELYFKQTGSVLRYEDLSDHASIVAAGSSNSDVIDWVVPNDVPVVYMSVSCSLPGTMNEAYFTILRNGRWLDMSSSCNFYALPGDKIRMRGRSWAWWGQQTLKCTSFKAWSHLDEGLLLGAKTLVSGRTFTGVAQQTVRTKIEDIVIPSGCDQIAICFWGKFTSSTIEVYQGETLLKSGTPNYQSRLVVNVTEHSTISIYANMIGYSESDDDSTSYYAGSVAVDEMIVVYKTILSKGLLLRSPTKSFIFKCREDGKRWNSSRLMVESSEFGWDSDHHLTGIDGAVLLNDLADKQGKGWINLSQLPAPELSINGKSYAAVSINVVNGICTFLLNNGEQVSVFQNDEYHECYSQLSATLATTSEAERVETMTLLPKETGTYYLGNKDRIWREGYFKKVYGAVYNRSGVQQDGN